MHPLIESRRAELAELCRRFGVRRLEVFGSAARGDDFDEATSDVDLLVEFEAQGRVRSLGTWFELKDALADVLGRDVDLVDPRLVDNPYIRASIDRDRVPIYGT